MLVPRISAALAEADSVIAGVSLSAKRHGARVADEILSQSAHATSSLEKGPDLGLAVAVIDAVATLPSIAISPMQAIAALHAVVGLSEPVENRGRPRADFVENDRLMALADVARSTQPALLVGAILHGELLSMSPFGTHNGLIARAVLRGVLTQRGIEPLISTEIGLGDLGINALALALSEYQKGTADGVATWVEFNVKAVEFGAKALMDVINRPAR